MDEEYSELLGFKAELDSKIASNGSGSFITAADNSQSRALNNGLNNHAVKNQNATFAAGSAATVSTQGNLTESHEQLPITNTSLTFEERYQIHLKQQQEKEQSEMEMDLYSKPKKGVSRIGQSQSQASTPVDSHWQAPTLPPKLDHSPPMPVKRASRSVEILNRTSPVDQSEIQPEIVPISLSPHEVQTDLDMGSMVEVLGNPEEFRYGVVRWMGYLRDRNKPMVGLEMVRVALI